VLVALDAGMGASRRGLSMVLTPPIHVSAGGAASDLRVRLSFARRGAPRLAEVAVQTNAHLSAAPTQRIVRVQDLVAEAQFGLAAVRRGEGRVDRLWVRWRGPLGLAFKQHEFSVPEPIPVIPDVAGAKAEAARLFAREAPVGVKVVMDRGQGSEYQSLQEFQQGMDPRTVDWPQSARHGMLLAKEYRTERNHPVFLCLDAGRLMSEPVAGAPKIDRAINAALLLGYAGLKVGDRVGLFAFDDKPRVFSRAVSGVRAFPSLQTMAARIDYSTEETNFTLGLSTLSGELERRALVVVFTDFADTTGAELMLDSIARMVRRHLLMFVVFQDDELEGLARTAPRTAEDITRAVVADALLRERQVVMTRLRRLGVEIVEAPVDKLGPALIARYLDLKRGDRL